jgi:DNA-binding MarR family transcriptional regulator
MEEFFGSALALTVGVRYECPTVDGSISMSHANSPTLALVNSASVSARVSAWLEAARWRRAVERELRKIDLTFTQWLLLDGARSLISASGDAVSQVEIAELVELDAMTVSRVTTTLARRGLISREPAFGRPTYRIWLNAAGESALAAGRRCLEVACLDAQRQIWDDVVP